jgi:uncharacterized membrane protein
MEYKKKNILIKIWDGIWALFLQGLFTLLPIAVTIALFSVSIRILRRWLEPIQKWVPGYFEDIPYAEFILAIITIFLIGAILRFFVMAPLVQFLENAIVARIPIVRPIYFGLKQLIGAFTVQDQITFKHVVLVEFPHKGIYSVGFMTSITPKQISPDGSEDFYNVYIPTTPNPTTGYFTLIPKDACKILDISRQEATALIISGGIIQPDRFKN